MDMSILQVTGGMVGDEALVFGRGRKEEGRKWVEAKRSKASVTVT